MQDTDSAAPNLAELPALPAGIKPLPTAESRWLARRYPDLSPSPDEGCPTCRGRKTFRWHATRDGRRTAGVVEYRCPCPQQWLAEQVLLHAGIGRAYQRLDWADFFTPPQGIEQVVDYAARLDDYVQAGAGLFLWGSRGCIQGDALIAINRGGKGWQIKLRDLVTRHNGEDPRYRWDPKIPTYVQREADDGTVRLALLTNAWRSGVKTTYTVTTDSGRAVRATDEHPFFTERGWLRLDQLVVGDQVHVRGSQTAGQLASPKKIYLRISGLAYHPYARKCWASKAVALHRLVVEASLNHMDYYEFVRRLRAGSIEGLTFLDPAEWAVHHIDHDHLNNESGNLKVMTHPEHHRLHAEEGKTRSVLYKSTTERVVSVELHGEEPTFDLEVADDPHNFLANGFVVHNSGKTMSGNLLLKRLVGMGVDVYQTSFTDLLDSYAAGWRSAEDQEWFLRRVRNARVLGLDEVGREYKGAKINDSVLESVLRHRAQHCLPTILMSNLSPADVGAGYGGHSLSLLTERAIVVEMSGQDARPAFNERMLAELRAGLTRPVVV